jgi:hypothetical protein
MDPIASSRLQDDSKKKTTPKSFDYAKDDNEKSAPALTAGATCKIEILLDPSPLRDSR